MNVSSEVKRTLVKSPPELWSELSDAESLARHLSDLGEIRITRSEPESALDWEADEASGTVRLEPSGFGTKVTLSLMRELPEPQSPPHPEPVAIAEPEPEPQSVSNAQPEPEPEPEPEPIALVEPLVEPEPVAEPEPKLGFFARLFRRGRKRPIAVEPIEPTVAVEPIDPVPVAIEPEAATRPELEAEPVSTKPLAKPKPASVAISEPIAEHEPAAETEPAAEPTPGPVADVAVDLAALEAEMAEQDETLLTAMLDRLGAAHHRPFSRA